jgi:hypothetical protein
VTGQFLIIPVYQELALVCWDRYRISWWSTGTEVSFDEFRCLTIEGFPVRTPALRHGHFVADLGFLLAITASARVTADRQNRR